MVTQVYGAGLCGIDGFLVTVECSVRNSLHEQFELVGLPDTAVREAKERVRCACENSGFRFPRKEILVNLAPANLKKEGSAYDLPILCALLRAVGALPEGMDFSDKCFVGELALGGVLRPQNGVLSLCLAARAAGIREIYVPEANAAEAAAAPDMTVYGVKDFASLAAHLLGKTPLTPTRFDRAAYEASMASRVGLDFSEIRGQAQAKRAAEIAAAGEHNLLLIGPPGSGKSMLAKRIPGILPPLSFEEALETTRIHSVAGVLNRGLVTERPFRSPHHTVSAAGMVGGGSTPRPGEISLSHNGVLFLDELTEFPASLLETLRQPLEDGRVTVTRAAARSTYPAAFTLVCAMNPCRCGYYGDRNRPCTCRPQEIRRYLSRVSGPMLDRLDLQVELPSQSYSELKAPAASESSAAVRARVVAAREFARERFEATGDTAAANGRMSPAEVQRHCTLTPEGERLMAAAFEKLGLSARGHDKLLRVARTIADLDAAPGILPSHLAEAIQYRTLDRKYWQRESDISVESDD